MSDTVLSGWRFRALLLIVLAQRLRLPGVLAVGRLARGRRGAGPRRCHRHRHRAVAVAGQLRVAFRALAKIPRAARPSRPRTRKPAHLHCGVRPDHPARQGGRDDTQRVPQASRRELSGKSGGIPFRPVFQPDQHTGADRSRPLGISAVPAHRDGAAGRDRGRFAGIAADLMAARDRALCAEPFARAGGQAGRPRDRDRAAFRALLQPADAAVWHGAGRVSHGARRVWRSITW